MANKALEVLPPATELHRGERASIKMISAIIRPEKLDVVKEALNRLNLVGGITVTDVRGFGRQRGCVQHHMGAPYRFRFLDKVKIEMVVSNEDAKQVMTLITQLAYTGTIGDGKVFMIEVLAARRIRTGEKGLDAL